MTKKTVWTMQHALLAALCLFATTSLHATASFAQEHSVVMTGDAVDADIRAWTEIQDDQSIVNLQAYLDRFPDGLFADLARDRLSELQPTEKRDDTPEQVAGDDQSVRKPKKAKTQRTKTPTPVVEVTVTDLEDIKSPKRLFTMGDKIFEVDQSFFGEAGPTETAAFDESVVPVKPAIKARKIKKPQRVKVLSERINRDGERGTSSAGGSSGGGTGSGGSTAAGSSGGGTGSGGSSGGGSLGSSGGSSWN